MRDRNRGFTLIELMIVVSVIGILASIAIPNYKQMLLRSKRAELPLNLDGIRISEQSYHHEWEEYTSCALLPLTIPGRERVSRPAANILRPAAKPPRGPAANSAAKHFAAKDGFRLIPR